MVFPCDTSLMAVELKWNKQKCWTFKRTWGININKEALNLIIWCFLLCVSFNRKRKWNVCFECWLNGSEWMRWITHKHTYTCFFSLVLTLDREIKRWTLCCWCFWEIRARWFIGIRCDSQRIEWNGLFKMFKWRDFSSLPMSLNYLLTFAHPS